MIEQLEKESWGLDYYLAQFILPRVLYFKNWCDRYGYPADLEIDEWEEILDEIVWAFMFASQSYPRTTNRVIENIEIEFGEKDERGFVNSTLTKIFKEGYTEEDYENALAQDERNVQRCQRGLNLFAQYYMSLWN